MKRPGLALAIILALIVGTGLVVGLLGFSRNAIILATLLAAALSWAPTLLALEALERDDDG